MIERIIAILCVTIIFPSSLCLANRGMTPVDPGVQLFEPNQRALIAWDGEEEILLLSTDVSASESTLVLEVLPLRSEPLVKKGDLETFRRATALINRNLQAALGKKNGGRSTEDIALPAGEVTYHEKIGAHDISVTHLLDADGFVDWVRQYLDSLGVEGGIVSEEMKGLIEGYIADEFTWFVFDLVTIGIETVTNEPIQYRFKTDHLFYPLKITSTVEGSTAVELLVLTPWLLRRFPGLPVSRIELKHDPVSINEYDLQYLDKDMHSLLKGYTEMKLRIWELTGDLKSFDRDIIGYPW